MSDDRHILPRQLTVAFAQRWRWLACGCVWLACLVGTFAYAQDPDQAEQRLERIRKELSAIARERRQLESRRGAAAQQLRQADEQVSAAARALREVEAQLREDQAALDRLRLRRTSADSRLDELRSEFARLVRSRYIRDESNTLKQLFADEGEKERVRTYHDYLHRYLLQRITTLQDDLAEVERLESEIADRKSTLESTRAEQQQLTRELERERRTRAKTQLKLDSQYASHTARERALGQDARALEALLSRLREASGGSESSRIALLPGSLIWPLSGKLVHRFGQRLPDGRSSTGLLIDAPLGAPVHAVADGTVVFSEWMTGYGMLLIIDHGHGKMSLYAHNESLLKQAGATARRGETIASVGHSGGQDSSGLYFELRQDGQPVNPEKWLQRD